jgi:hypothetical protein
LINVGTVIWLLLFELEVAGHTFVIFYYGINTYIREICDTTEVGEQKER